MTQGPESHDAWYDVIVIGSGPGGISAGAILAKAGKKVLVVERSGGPGGYAHHFQRGPYTIDPAVHSVFDDRFFDALLKHLGVRSLCTFLPVEHFYTAILPDFRIDTEFGENPFVEIHVQKFPRQADAIRRFFRLCSTVFDGAHHLSKVALRDLDEVAQRFPEVFRYGKATVRDVLDEYFDDERIKAVCGAPSVVLGLPPSKLSFNTYAQFLISNMRTGTFCAQGGAQALVDAFVEALRRHGGHLLLGRTVSQILVESGRAVGIRLSDGEEIRTSTVVSNADALQTFRELVGFEHLPNHFLRRLNRMRPSISGFSVYAATSLDLEAMGMRDLTFIFKSWDFDALWQNTLSGDPSVFVLLVSTLLDPSMAPSGEHLLVGICPAPYDLGRPWWQEKAHYQEAFLQVLDAAMPGFREHVTFLETATPLALEEFSLNTQGALYGWENTPDQSGSRRLSHITPIEGLFLSGHWTQPGSSFARCVLSGVHTAQMIIPGLPLGEAAPDLPPAEAAPRNPRSTTAPERAARLSDSSLSGEGAQITSEENKALVIRIYEEMVNGIGVARSDGPLASDVIRHNALLGAPAGIAGFNAWVALLKTAMPDLHATVEDIFAEGDTVASRVVMTGTHTGPFMGVPPTGKRLRAEEFGIFRVENGKVAETWGVFDRVSLFGQLGLMSPPRPPAPREGSTTS